MADPAALWDSWRMRRDEEAFETLVRPELGRALAFARSLGCTAEDAEDAVQESLVRLAAERGDGPSLLGVRAWLYRTVRDRARSRRRSWWRSRARERTVARPESVASSGPGTGAREEVEHALRALSADEREAVTLRFLQDLDYAEVAAVLGVSEGACRLRVHRALERLRSTLGPGAATMIAALPLPGFAKGTSIVKAALAGAGGGPAASGTGAAAGGMAMASASKVAVGAACAAIGLAAGIGVGTVGSSGTPVPAPVPPAAAPEVRDSKIAAAVPDEPSSAEPTGPRAAGPVRPLPASLSEMKPDEEEVDFLRRALAAERSRREAARVDPGDGGLDILRRVRESGTPAREVLGSFAAMAAHVRTGAGEIREVATDGTEPTRVNLGDLAGKSAVIQFGPGTFTFDRRGAAFHRIGKEQVIESLEIRGAGMDRTTLVLAEEDLLLVSGSLRNLRIRDLTLGPGGNGRNALDVRGDIAAALENVRFLDGNRFLHLAGPGFLAARGCEFLGAGGGLLLAFRARGLALFEDCLFADLETVVLGWTGAAAGSEVRFSGCTFENCRVADSRLEYQGKPEFPVHVAGCKVLYGPPEMADEKRRERWGAGWLASLERTTLGPGLPRCRVSDILAVLQAASVPTGEVAFCVRPVELSREGVRCYALDLVNRESQSRRVQFLAWAGGILQEERRTDPGGGYGLPQVKDVEGALVLAEAVRLSGIPQDSACKGIVYGVPAQVSGRAIPSLHVMGADDWPSWTLNATTGEVLFGGPR